MLVAGALAHEGYLSLPIVMLCSFAGSLAGDEAEYYAGRRYGRAFMAAHPRLNRAGLRIHALLTRYDALFMLGFRFMYGVRIVTPLLLALEGVPPGRFLLYNTVGALIWAILASMAGYGLGGRSSVRRSGGSSPFGRAHGRVHRGGNSLFSAPETDSRNERYRFTGGMNVFPRAKAALGTAFDV